MATALYHTPTTADEATVYLNMAARSRLLAAAGFVDHKSNARLWLTLARCARLEGRCA